MESGSGPKALLLVAAAAGLSALAWYSQRGPRRLGPPGIGAVLVAQGRPQPRSAGASAAAVSVPPSGEDPRVGYPEAVDAPALEPPPPGEGRPFRAGLRTPAFRLAGLDSGFTAGSSARYLPAGPSAQASPGAPTAAPRGAVVPRGAAAPARDAGEPPREGDSRRERLALEAETAGLSKDERLSAKVAGVLAAARDLKIVGDSGQVMQDEPHLAAAILQQIDADRKVDEGVRGALAQLQASGRPVTPLERQRAAAAVLEASGRSAQDEDADLALARADIPPAAAVAPAAYAAAAQQVVANPPDPATRAEILKHVDEPRPAPRAPPPRGALDAYQKNRTVFDRALKEYGVQPQHILGILGVETSFGHNTGGHPLRDTLLTLSGQLGSNGRPTSRALQAQRDLAALTRLTAQGDLGDLKPTQVRGSWAGAMGVPQFLPTSWEAYARDADGGGRDPFSFPDSVLSVANYLNRHGYAGDVSRSIYGYNHSQQYVDKVLGLSAQIKAGLP
ncbi:MAG: lytic murein transglycosylase [Elusimicrobia bacterium]|nr:lytic murein transglycosylase [Elusimicrobiota bacterium]